VSALRSAQSDEQASLALAMTRSIDLIEFSNQKKGQKGNNPMSRNAFFQAFLCVLGVLAFVLLLTGLSPGDAVAQQGPDCAECTDCVSCGAAWWGGEQCDFQGDPCACREVGGNCNPSLWLHTAPEDQRIVNVESGPTLLVRLERGSPVFGTWDCGNGLLTLAYFERENGALVPVTPEELGAYRERITFADMLASSPASSDS